MEDEEYWKPFEVLENEEGKTLLSAGGQIRADDVEKILKAIKRGWNIDIKRAAIEGVIDIGKIGLDLDEDDQFIIAGKVWIRSSRIIGVSFDRAHFMKKASFAKTRFSGIASFIGARFEFGVDFSDSCFGNKVDLCGAKFDRTVEFRRAHFENLSLFSGAVFVKVDFNAAHFDGLADFSHKTRFERKAKFSHARFLEKADFCEAFFAVACFDEVDFEGVADFSKARFEKKANFSGVKMEYPANFAGVRFRENRVCKAVLWNWGLWRLLRVKQWKATFTDVSTINTNIVMDASSNPRLKRYIDDEQWIESWRQNPKGRWWREHVFRLWERTSHCGRSIGLWAAWSLFFVLLFSVIFTPSPHWWPDLWWGFWRDNGVAFQQTAPAYMGKPVGFWSCLYFSIVNFTTLGFGDIVAANGLARFGVALEVVLGYVMLGGLISIFANKFARRS